MSIKAGDKVKWRGRSAWRTGVVIRVFSIQAQIRNDRGNEYWLPLNKLTKLAPVEGQTTP